MFEIFNIFLDFYLTLFYCVDNRFTETVYMVSTQMHNQSVRLTKTVIDSAPLPERGQTFLRDADLKGFGLRLTANGARTFIVEKRIKGKVQRMTLGRYGELTVQQARLKAQMFLGQIAMGQNPIQDKQRVRLEAITLKEAVEDFLRARTGLKEKTIYEYRRFLEVAFAEWRDRPLNKITKDHVAAHHQHLGATRGEYYANGAMRFLRSLFNFALDKYEDGMGRGLLSENPVLRLTRTRAWYRTERRKTVLRIPDLPAWAQAVSGLRAPEVSEPQSETPELLPRVPEPQVGTPDVFAETVADYLMMLLFTGLRRQEAAQLRWSDIDFGQRSLTIRDPKNREAHTLPLSDYLEALLRRRHETHRSAYIFDGNGKKGYLIEPKRWVQKVQAESGVTFTLHDLRRTFATIAEGLEISSYTLKRLLNHKMRNDVTAGYIVSDLERLRRPMQQITDFLCAQLELGASAPGAPFTPPTDPTQSA